MFTMVNIMYLTMFHNYFVTQYVLYTYNLFAVSSIQKMVQHLGTSQDSTEMRTQL